jgi:hypothetical protein
MHFGEIATADQGAADGQVDDLAPVDELPSPGTDHGGPCHNVLLPDLDLQAA